MHDDAKPAVEIKLEISKQAFNSPVQSCDNEKENEPSRMTTMKDVKSRVLQECNSQKKDILTQNTTEKNK